jgi:hypothetical protein
MHHPHSSICCSAHGGIRYTGICPFMTGVKVPAFSWPSPFAERTHLKTKTAEEVKQPLLFLIFSRQYQESPALTAAILHDNLSEAAVTSSAGKHTNSTR